MTHVLDELPLWIGGDLSPEASAAVEDHLRSCPECRAAARDLEEALRLLREDPGTEPTAQDLAGLRDSVMAQIRAEPRPARLRRFRPQLLAAAGLLLALAGIRLAHHPVQAPLPKVAALPQLPYPQPPPEDLRPPSPPPAARVQRPSTRSPSLQAQPAEASDPMEAPIARIEFRTTDPPLRIIWLANTASTPSQETP
jgi:hypothetical protein